MNKNDYWSDLELNETTRDLFFKYKQQYCSDEACVMMMLNDIIIAHNKLVREHEDLKRKVNLIEIRTGDTTDPREYLCIYGEHDKG